MLFAAFAGQTHSSGSVPETLMLAAAIFSGSGLSQIILAGGGASLRLALQNPKIIFALNLLSGLGVTLFGLSGILL